MKPNIDGSKFGSITLEGETFDHDIMIRLGGKVKKRKKKLSKQQYGTSHTVSLAEAEHIYDDGAEQVIVGTGKNCHPQVVRRGQRLFQGSWLLGSDRPDTGRS